MFVAPTEEIDAAGLMEFNPAVVTLETDIADAVDLMLEENVGALLVVDAGEVLAGMVTASALIGRVAGRLHEHSDGWLRSWLFATAAANSFARLHGRHVSEVLDTSYGSVGLGTPLQQIVERMEQTKAERLPVCSRGKVIGVITRAGVLRAMVEQYRPRPQPQSDAQILRQLHRELRHHAWLPRQGVDVSVENGVVQLNGTISEGDSATKSGLSRRTCPASRRSETTCS